LIKITLLISIIKQKYYSEKIFSDVLTQNHFDLFGDNLNQKNRIITFCGINHSHPFHTLAINEIYGLDYLEKTKCFSFNIYDKEGNRHDNITDWGLNQFTSHYQDTNITKEDIFYYTYSVLHNPVYRKKYELNLKREFPRLPFYDDFQQWVSWGKKLMELHIDYETVAPFNLKVIDNSSIKDKNYKLKVKLKADKTQGVIAIDEHTHLLGIPESAWLYKLGNRSALEWVLDQYKEKKYTDKTIAENFNTYRFADYKLHVIVLLKRVCTVSVETMKIIEEMNK
jgi:predicted helicase